MIRSSEAAGEVWSATRYDANARFVSDLGAPVLALLAPRPGERILDLGCGDGALTARLIEAGAQVVGLDDSADMVAAAQARGIDARVACACALEFNAEFDAVFSNAAMHWMTRPDAVIAGVRRALRPGGRFVAEFGGMGNVAAIRTALIAVLSRDYGIETDLSDIWYFPSAPEYAKRLAAGGFAVDRIELIPRPTAIVSGMEAWLDTLAAPVLAKLPAKDRNEARTRAAALAAPALRDEQGEWTADYMRIRFAAHVAGE